MCWEAAVQKSAFAPPALSQGQLGRQKENKVSSGGEDPRGMNLYGWKDVGAKSQCLVEVTNGVLDEVYDPPTSKTRRCVFCWELGVLS